MDQNLGVIAENDEGRILGYMIFIAPLDGFFGICDGAFSPLGGSWVSSELSEKDRFNVMSKLVEKSLDLLVSKEITSVAICQNAADKEIIDSLCSSNWKITLKNLHAFFQKTKMFLNSGKKSTSHR